MGKRKDVSKMAKALHEAGAVNLDMKVSDLLRTDGLAAMDPDGDVSATIVALDGYVIYLASKLDEKVRPIKSDIDIRADLEGKLRDVLSDTRR